MSAPLKWATWPWTRCGARATLDEGLVHCELRKHRAETAHRIERGMYDVVWTNPSRLE